MLNMIRQFTFHKPREILQPTLWLFLSQACSMLSAILAYMAIYTLGQAFVPPYTMDLSRLVTLATMGVGCFVLQYAVELISYYFTYGKAYRDTADKRIAYIQKLRRQPLGFFSSKESGALISSFSGDFAGLRFFPYDTDRLTILCPIDHPLTKLHRPVRFIEALEYEYIGLTSDFALERVVEEKAAEAGVEVRYEAVISACRVESGILREIRWSDPEGEHTATATCFIDATGDALLCDLAGARLSHGRTSDGLFQPFSNSMLQVNGLDVGMCNFDAGRIDQYCEPAFSRMMLTSSHLHLREDFSLFRKLIAASELPGVREGRRLENGNPYTLAEFFASPDLCEEPIFYVWSNLDTHTNDIALESDLFGEWLIACSMWGINLGIPVPRRVLSAAGAGVKNLLAAGRHLAVDHDLGHALRMTALMGAVGETAGVIAAQAAANHVLPDEVPYSELREHLALTPEVTRENGCFQIENEEEIRQALDSDSPGCAQWSARNRLPDATLIRWMNEAPEGSRLRCHAAMVLAMKRNPAGLAVLCAMVRARDPYTPVHSRLYNHKRGYAALFCLGLLAEPETYTLLRDVLLSDTAECAYEYQTHALAALVKLGDRHPELRHEIAGTLRKRAEDPGWALLAQLKGTRDTHKRMDPIFRAFLAATLKRWGEENRIVEVMEMMELDPFEQLLRDRV